MKSIWYIISGFIILLVQTVVSLYAHLNLNINPISIGLRAIYILGLIFIFIWIISCTRHFYSDKESLPLNIIIIGALICGAALIITLHLFYPNEMEARNLLLLIYSLMSFVIAVFETRLYYTLIQPFSRDFEEYNFMFLPLFAGSLPIINVFVPIIFILLSMLKFSPKLLMLVLTGTHILHIAYLVMYSMLTDAIDEILKNEETQMYDDVTFMEENQENQ